MECGRSINCGAPTVLVTNEAVEILNVEPISNSKGFGVFFGYVFLMEKNDESEKMDKLTAADVFQLLECLNVEDISRLLPRLHGSWAFIYYSFSFKRVFIGRDVFGRKSLLWSRNKDQLIISPLVINEGSWNEVPPGTLSLVILSELWKNVNILGRETGEILWPWTREFHSVAFDGLDTFSGKKLRLNRCFPDVDKECNLSQVDEFTERFKRALQRCLFDLNDDSHSVSILFSGGIDSLLIAVLIEPLMQKSCSIDLINVSFGKKPEDFAKAPDRIRATKAYLFLKNRFPEIHYRLILVNVNEEELVSCRSSHITALIYPADSVMDDSIGCVLWFAARGEGLIFEEGKQPREMISTRSEAKLAFVGSGADEIFGGYMRHRLNYVREGRDFAAAGMEEDLMVIGEKNLGRDDRVTAIHGREVRAPYLDELFVRWAVSLPLEEKADFSQPRGVGEKCIIRKVLKTLGIPENMYSAPKQAMQFGTRISRLGIKSQGTVSPNYL